MYHQSKKLKTTMMKISIYLTIQKCNRFFFQKYYYLLIIQNNIFIDVIVLGDITTNEYLLK